MGPKNSPGVGSKRVRPRHRKASWGCSYSVGRAGQDTKMILENFGDLGRTFVGHGKRSGLCQKDTKWKVLSICMTTEDLFLRLPSRIWKQTDSRIGHCKIGWAAQVKKAVPLTRLPS